MNSNIETITPASSTSVSAADLRAHLRANTTAEDSLLTDWITAAEDMLCRVTGYVPMSSTYRLRMDGWTCSGTIYVPRHPVTAVSLVEYLDTDGDWQTVSADDYTTDLGVAPARVIFASDYTFPALHVVQRPCVRVTFTAGNASASDVPALAKTAIKLLAAHWFLQRSAFSADSLKNIPMGWYDLVSQFSTGITSDWNPLEEVHHHAAWTIF